MARVTQISIQLDNLDACMVNPYQSSTKLAYGKKGPREIILDAVVTLQIEPTNTRLTLSMYWLLVVKKL